MKNMRLLNLTTIVLLTLNFQTFSQSVTPKRIVCVERAALISALQELKQYDIQKRQLEVYKRQVDTLQAQVVLLDSVVTMATAHIQTLDSVIVESESVVDTLQIANTKYEEKIQRMKKWHNIKTGFLVGLLILTTIL